MSQQNHRASAWKDTWIRQSSRASQRQQLPLSRFDLRLNYLPFNHTPSIRELSLRVQQQYCLFQFQVISHSIPDQIVIRVIMQQGNMKKRLVLSPFAITDLVAIAKNLRKHYWRDEWGSQILQWELPYFRKCTLLYIKQTLSNFCSSVPWYWSKLNVYK